MDVKELSEKVFIMDGNTFIGLQSLCNVLKGCRFKDETVNQIGNNMQDLMDEIQDLTAPNDPKFYDKSQDGCTC